MLKKDSVSLVGQRGETSKITLFPKLCDSETRTNNVHFLSAFFHKRDTNNKDFAVGQAVSFVIQAGPKGASAKHIMEEESGETIPVEEEGEREYGKVKSFNEEKGFAFIVSNRVHAGDGYQPSGSYLSFGSFARLPAD